MSLLEITFLSPRDIWMLSTVILCLVFLADDIFIDLLALFKKLGPKKLTSLELEKMDTLKQKRIAIVIANWKEEDVLERMIAGNIAAIEYDNYEIFIGVYPNDDLTLAAAKRAETVNKKVTVVINSLIGPTSKGQMLNQIVSYISRYNTTQPNNSFDLVLMQDSEDIIHPKSLKLVNLRAEQYDFIQIPVFSLPLKLSKLTAGIYVDEFIESHTKDLLVRQNLNAGIPSAGVGTAIKWSAIEKLFKIQNGDFLNEKTLTEDYHLGLTTHDLKLKQYFGCEFFEYKDKQGNEKVEFIATREFFPQKFIQSVKQKTRWALGISLQGFEQRRWKTSHFFETYFLWRDRKGLPSAPLFTVALVFTGYFLYSYFFKGYWPSLDYAPYNTAFVAMMWANLIVSVCRIVQRIYLVKNVYGLKLALLVPVRWVLSNFVNTASTYNAVFKWTQAKIKGELPAWSKTQHVVPEGFGLPNVTILEDSATISENLSFVENETDTKDNAEQKRTETTTVK